MIALLLLLAHLSSSPVVLKTGCDEVGNCSYVVEFPDQPMTVKGGSEEFVLLRTFFFSLPEVSHCWEARTFIGLDGGDRGEFDITLTTRNNYHFADRSFHRHRSSSFESWWPHYINVTAQHFNVIILGRVIHTNDDEQNPPSFGKLRARFHIGLKMMCKEISNDE